MYIDFITAGSRAGLINPPFLSRGIEKAARLQSLVTKTLKWLKYHPISRLAFPKLFSV